MTAPMDHGLLAAALAVALGLLKVLEKALTWVFAKMRPSRPAVVELGPKSRDLVLGILARAEDSAEILGRADADGTPLVYGPRKDVRRVLDMLGHKSNGRDD